MKLILINPKQIFTLIFLLLQIWYAAAQSKIERLDGSLIAPDSLTRRIEILMKNAHIDGMEVAVFNKKNPVYTRAFGTSNRKTGKLLTTSTNMYGASLSKPVFAVLVMKLIEEKVIALDTPLQHYLPKPIYDYPHKVWHEDFTAFKDDKRYLDITARMCLSHTTGLPNWRWYESDEKLRIKFTPGSRYSYSGEGLTYLQVVLEKITGKSLEQLAQEKVFGPLKMTSTSYRWQPSFESDYASGHDGQGKVYPKDKDNDPRGAGSLETNLDDYCKFISAMLKGNLLKKSSFQQMFSPQIAIRSKTQFGPGAIQDGDWNDSIGLACGLGWGLLKSPYGPGAFKAGHGDGFQHYSIVFPDSGKAIVILSNSDNAESTFKYLLEAGIADTFTPWAWEGYVPYDQK